MLQDEVNTSLYEEKQKEAAEHEGAHLPAQPTPAWVEPGTTTKATGDEHAATAKATGAVTNTAAETTGAKPGSAATPAATGPSTTAEVNGAGSLALSGACIVFVLGGPGTFCSVTLPAVPQPFHFNLLGYKCSSPRRHGCDKGSLPQLQGQAKAHSAT